MSKRTNTVLAFLFVILVCAGVYWWIRPADAAHSRASLDEQITAAKFTPLHPPSLLTPPGSFVRVLSRDPLSLGLVCRNTACLGEDIGSLIVKSDSADSGFQARFEGTFSLQGEALEHFGASVNLQEVQRVSLRLSNVMIYELADSDVMGSVDERALECTAAIALRRGANQEVTLIKAALVADATYSVKFSSELSIEAQEAALEGLAGRLGMQASKTGEHTISGESLIWGVRDDALLASLPHPPDVPMIGSEGEERGILSTYAPATVVSLPDPFAAVFSHAVEPLRQPDSMSCWATVAAMMVNWRDEKLLGPDELVASLGDPWQLLFDLESGITAEEQEAFCHVVGLVSEAPQNFTLQGYEALLRDYGPVWFTTGDLFSSHARLLIGLARSEDPNAESFFQLVDPANGRVEVVGSADFVAQFERQARDMVEIKPDDELPRQVLHWPSQR